MGLQGTRLRRGKPCSTHRLIGHTYSEQTSIHNVKKPITDSNAIDVDDWEIPHQ
jgi:hypothetical protein